MTHKLDDVWSTRDFPVLVSAALMLDEVPGRALQAEEIAATTGIDLDDVTRALVNLATGYLDVDSEGSMSGRWYLIHGITERGLREVGSWPSPETGADRLIAALEREVDSAPEGSPKHKRLRGILDGFAAAGRDVTVEVAAAVLTGRLPV